MLAVRADGDFDPLTESVQEAKQTVEGVPLDAATDEGGHLRLVDPEEIGGLRLGELSLGDEVSDELNKFRLGKR
jgi:hypothetical protein